MIAGDWTNADLLAWANGLNLCEFKKDKRFGLEESLCEGRDGSIRLHLSRFAEGSFCNAGERSVSLIVNDIRPYEVRPWDGMSYMTSDLREIERDIERYGTALKLLKPQMSLF